jgi:hypothetical protein
LALRAWQPSDFYRAISHIFILAIWT